MPKGRPVFRSDHAFQVNGDLDPGQHRLDRVHGGVELLRIARAHHQIGVALAVLVHERIAADDGVGMGGGDRRASGVPTSPSRASARTLSDSIFTPVFSFGATMSSMRLHDRRHAGHDDDIAEHESGRENLLVADQRRRRRECAPCAGAPR